MPKPVRKKKHFIRKKESTTYRLIPGYVEDEDEVSKPSEEELEKRREEQMQHGIFFGDEYNYMKHLRSVTETATMVETEINPEDEKMSQATTARVPWREFFSTDETEEEKIDPEILAALDEAPVVPLTENETEELGFDNILDDDFLAQAGGVAPREIVEEADEYAYSDNSQDLSDDEDDKFSLESFSDASDRLGLSDDEDGTPAKTQGRGTKEDDIIEAQTAAILKNFEEGLGFHFSNLESVDDQEMPSAEDYEYLKHIMKQDVLKEKPASWFEVLDNRAERAKVDSSKYIYEDEDEYEWKDVPPSKPKYDCVSILSLRSNTRNLPTDLLPPPKERSKASSKIETDSESNVNQGLTLRELEKEMRDSRRADKASTFRPENETAEEKRARKKAVKDERKERRQEKKANKMVFSIENEKMKSDTAKLSKSVKSIKL